MDTYTYVHMKQRKSAQDGKAMFFTVHKNFDPAHNG